MQNNFLIPNEQNLTKKIDVTRNRVVKKYLSDVYTVFFEKRVHPGLFYSKLEKKMIESINGVDNAYEIFLLVDDFLKYIPRVQNFLLYREQLYELFVKRTYETLYFGRPNLIDNFLFLCLFFNLNQISGLDLKEETIIKIIKNESALFDNFSDNMKKRENFIFMNTIIKLLVYFKKEKNKKVFDNYSVLETITSQDIVEYFQDAIAPLEKEAIKILSYDVDEWFKYVEKTKLEYKKFEHLFLTSPSLCFKYAMIFNKRFIEGEPIIAQDEEIFSNYISFFVKTEDPTIEPLVAQYASTSYRYALTTKKYRKTPAFPMGESQIAKSPMYAMLYALHVLEDRFPEGEKTIEMEPFAQSYYEKLEIIKKQNNKCEK